MDKILLLSLAASMLILTSTLPVLIRTLRARQYGAKANPNEVLSRSMQCAGNVCWALVGHLSFNWPLMITACINVALLGALVYQLTRGR